MKRLLVKILLPILICMQTSAVSAQEITGVWHGHFRAGNMSSRSSVLDERYKFEVQIAQKEKSIEGVTYSYLSSFFYGKAAATGTVNLKNGKVLLQEIKLLEVRNQSGDICIMTCFLQYTKVADEEFLEGTYISMNVRDSSNCGRGTVFLRKVPNSDFYKEPFLEKREKELGIEKLKGSPDTPLVAKNNPPPPAKKTQPVAKNQPAKTTPLVTLPPKPGTRPETKPGPQTTTKTTPKNTPKTTPKESPRESPPAKTAQSRIITTPIAPGKDTSRSIDRHFQTISPHVLQSRSNVLVKTITVHTTEIELNIYDDGAIDHDTVSIYIDNRQVIGHRMLTDRALVLKLHMDENEDYHELVMVAENEGEIPPNTSLMIVKAGDQEFEVRITSSEQKNAKVVFKFEKSSK